MTTIQYLGHSTTLITFKSGFRTIIDPWFEGNPKCPTTLPSFQGLNLICLTHGHGDHAGSALQLAKETGATVAATYELLMILVRQGLPEKQIQPMNKGGTITLESGIRVTLTNAFHSSSFDLPDGTAVYAGEPCGVVLRTPDGESVYHAGDTALFSDMSLIGELYRPQVALLPIGDRFTMGPAEAALAAKLIKPQVAIPIHYGTFGLLTGTPEEFEKHLSGSGIRCAPLEPGGSFQF